VPQEVELQPSRTTKKKRKKKEKKQDFLIQASLVYESMDFSRYMGVL
jgi:hypothetical protein